MNLQLRGAYFNVLKSIKYFNHKKKHVNLICVCIICYYFIQIVYTKTKMYATFHLDKYS